MKPLHFIGAVHSDQKSPQRLKKAFEFLKPHVLALEHAGDSFDEYLLSDENVAEQRKFEIGLRAIMDEFKIRYDETILKNSFYGEEVDFTRQYADDHKIPIFFTDDPKAVIELNRKVGNSDALLGELRQAIETAFLKGIKLDFTSSSFIADSNDHFYRPFEGHFKDPMGMNSHVRKHVFGMMEQGFIGPERDGHQAEILKRLITEFPAARIVNVGGIGHLSDVPRIDLPFLNRLSFNRIPTLYHRVKKWTEARYSLRQFDAI